MALISLEEAKTYLRVDSADEDAMISTLILSAGVPIGHYEIVAGKPLPSGGG